MWKKMLTVLLAHLAATSIAARADESLRAPPPGDDPVEVLVGFNLVNISDVGEKEETIDFEGAIYLEWKDRRLAYEPADYGMPRDWIPGRLLQNAEADLPGRS